MPAPPIIGKRVRAIHAALVEAGWVGDYVPRSELEMFMAQRMDMNPENIRRHIDMGRMLGLWQLVDRRPRATLLKVLPPSLAEPTHSALDIDPTRVTA